MMMDMCQIVVMEAMTTCLGGMFGGASDDGSGVAGHGFDASFAAQKPGAADSAGEREGRERCWGEKEEGRERERKMDGKEERRGMKRKRRRSRRTWRVGR